MKKLNTSLFLLICMIGLSSEAFSQVTMSQSDFPRAADFVDTFVIAANSSFISPAHGTDQVWEYSAATEDTIGVSTYMDASANSNYPNALNYRSRNLTFQGYFIQSEEYEALDADGWYPIGRDITDVTYSIASSTGGANDSLRFVGGSYIYPGTYNQLKFPVSYQNQWSMAYEQFIDYELTVAAFGLNKAPGKYVRYFTQDRDVVGEGKVVIPRADGSPSKPFKGLLIRVVRIATDSTFLGGSPAPAPLMAAFGLTQGAVAADSFYVIYAPGFGSPVLSLDIEGSAVANLVYRPGAAALGDEQSSVEEFAANDLTLGPNPVNKGSDLNIELSSSAAINSVHIINLMGQVIYEEKMESPRMDKFSISIPDNTLPGIYFVNLKNASGQIIGNKKIQIK
ncbi:MAG: T9SS type A sorting domain-containing protein [Bacteroidia bacterium]